MSPSNDPQASERSAGGVKPPSASPPRIRGRRVAQILFFSTVTWIILSFSVQVLSEGLFTRKTPRTSAECRVAIDELRGRLAQASMRTPSADELAAVRAFRDALSGTRANGGAPSDFGRSWDLQAFALVDGCPKAESEQAYALARLRATEETMTRIDAFDAAAARKAWEAASRTIAPTK